MGLPHWDRSSYDSYNGMASGAMSSDTRALLVERLQPHNRRLEALLGRELHWGGS